MAKSYNSLNSDLKRFMKEQKIFFVASAAKSGNVNLSPKGYDSLRIIDDSLICYLDYPGSGNETAIHMMEGGRLTIMFCSFTKNPLIMKIYGKGESLLPYDERFPQYLKLFDVEASEIAGEIVRQIFLIKIDSVLTSCGYGVPFFDYVGEREQLKSWALKKAGAGTLGEFMGRLKKILPKGT